MGRQARGYKSAVTVDFEAAYGVRPGVKKAFRVPVRSFEVAESRDQTPDEILTGSRNPVAPDEGLTDERGSADVPVDAHSFGIWLRGLFGLPTTEPVPALTLDAGNAVDKGAGKVGLPATGHGLAAGAPVLISGTTGYDGAHSLATETTDNELVIAAPYAAEAFDGTETVQLARVVTLLGDAADRGDGTVALPSKGHGLPVGAQVVITGTVNYDGTHVVGRGSGLDAIVITAAFVEESFDDTPTASAGFFDHTYVVVDDMPSFLAEKAFPDLPLYAVCEGLKLNSLGLSVGESGAMSASLDIVGRGETDSTQPYDASAVRLPLHKFQQRQARILEDGVLLADRLKTFSLDVSNDLDTEDGYTIGADGRRGSLSEGLMTLSGQMTALFKDTRFLEASNTGERKRLEILLVNSGYQLSLLLPECLYQRNTPAISGPKGVKEEFSYSAFHDVASEGSGLVVRLRNEIKTWEE